METVHFCTHDRPLRSLPVPPVFAADPAPRRQRGSWLTLLPLLLALFARPTAAHAQANPTVQAGSSATFPCRCQEVRMLRLHKLTWFLW